MESFFKPQYFELRTKFWHGRCWFACKSLQPPTYMIVAATPQWDYSKEHCYGRSGFINREQVVHAMLQWQTMDIDYVIICGIYVSVFDILKVRRSTDWTFNNTQCPKVSHNFLSLRAMSSCISPLPFHSAFEFFRVERSKPLADGSPSCDELGCKNEVIIYYVQAYRDQWTHKPNIHFIFLPECVFVEYVNLLTLSLCVDK